MQLTAQSMQRLLKNAAIEPAPGKFLFDSNFEPTSDKDRSGLKSTAPLSPMVPPIWKGLEEQKRDRRFQMFFNLPTTEHLMEEFSCEFSTLETSDFLSG